MPRRKIEGELKVTQESVADLERARKEFEATIQRKEKDAAGLMAKLDDEQSLVSKVQKSIKEAQARVEEMEEELEAERQSRAKAERQRSDLARELENLGDRLGEASGATAAQIELNKKREAEVTKLRYLGIFFYLSFMYPFDLNRILLWQSFLHSFQFTAVTWRRRTFNRQGSTQ